MIKEIGEGESIQSSSNDEDVSTPAYSGKYFELCASNSLYTSFSRPSAGTDFVRKGLAQFLRKSDSCEHENLKVYLPKLGGVTTRSLIHYLYPVMNNSQYVNSSLKYDRLR